MAKRSGSFARLIIMIVIAAVLFMGLALGEDYGKGFVKRWRSRTADSRADLDVAKTVTRYSQILQQVYEKDKPSLLKPVATDQQITKVRLYMTYDQVEKKRRLITKLKTLLVNQSKKKGKKATVKTTETWENNYQDITTKMMSDKKTESYKVQYNLIKTRKKWLVDSLEVKTL